MNIKPSLLLNDVHSMPTSANNAYVYLKNEEERIANYIYIYISATIFEANDQNYSRLFSIAQILLNPSLVMPYHASLPE